MIHPDTEVKPVNQIIGNGVFATNFIPKGTIVVVTDRYDVSITQEEYMGLPPIQKTIMEKYLYQDKNGHFILGWDHAKYMNHSCDSNTMMTDYGIEIAIKDIMPGEEITSEYGILNCQETYECYCGSEKCRHVIKYHDIDNYADIWDSKILESLLLLFQNSQPLWGLLNNDTLTRLETLRNNPKKYSSVRNLKWRMNGEDFNFLKDARDEISNY